MRKTLLTSAALLSLALMSPAMAQSLSQDAPQTWAHQPGTGESGPASAVASNINGADTRSEIAPHFPLPEGGYSASPERYLHDAARALRAHQTGVAQQALEMAETRLLDRSTPVSEANVPDQAPEIRHVTQARQALARNDIAGAAAAIDAALAQAPRWANPEM